MIKTILTVKQQDFSHNYELAVEKTTVNSFRKVIQSIARVNNLVLDEIILELDGIEIKYKSIQTKQGLSQNPIIVQELFRRGGKIFD